MLLCLPALVLRPSTLLDDPPGHFKEASFDTQPELEEAEGDEEEEGHH